VVLAKITGSIDELGRPVVRIEVPGRDGFLAVVDTGFNRSLLMQSLEAEAMGFTITEEVAVVELGTTLRVQVHRAIGKIHWLDQIIQVDTLVANEELLVQRPDLARALIGTALLADCLLLVDFRTRLVEIEDQR
jgi:predicted aspartyl protease